MPSWIKETKTVWERMKTCGKPVVLYGMGDGAVKIKEQMDQRGIPVKGIFASDGFVRGHSFLGFPVRRLSELEEELGDFLAVLCFAARDSETRALIQSIGDRHELVAPDVSVAGKTIFTMEFVQEHEEELEHVYSMLEDEQSRRVYSNVINYKLSGKLSYLIECETGPDELYRSLLQLGGAEIFADLGAYKGDTVEQLLHYTDGRCQKVFAFEPDIRNYKKLCAAVERMGLDSSGCYQLAAYSRQTVLRFDSRAGRQSAVLETEERPEGAAQVRVREVAADSLDHIAAGQRITFINMDVEGSEREALEGCRETIQKYAPKLLIAAYHRSEDLFSLPLQIDSIRKGYRFYLRHLPYFPAWDTNLICI